MMVGGWGLAVQQYLLEHGVVEFAGGIQGDRGVGKAFHNGKYHRDNYHQAINHLVEVQVLVF